MKRIITLSVCIFALLGFVKTDDDQSIPVNQLPQKSLKFIQKNFPKNEVSFAKMEKDFWDKKYEVVFVNGEKVEFDKNGEWKEIDCRFSIVPDPIIPEKLKDQLKKQYPKAKIIQIEQDKKGYEVKLENKLELKFTRTFQLYDIDN